MPKKSGDALADLIWVDDRGIVHIRNSERTTHDRCPQRWWWSWREGLRPKETGKALWFGSAIHAALADYYQPGKKRSKDYIDVFREFVDMEGEYIRTHVGDLDEDKWVDAKTLGETMLLGYHKHYGGDRNWDVIATEQSFELRVPFAGKGDNDTYARWLDMLKISPDWDPSWNTKFFILNGTFDGVYRDRDDAKIKLMEHKTAGSISVGHLTMDNQAGTYWAVAQSVGKSQGWLGKNENIRSITYNFLRKGMPDDRPQDENGHRRNQPKKEHYIAVLEPLGLLPDLKKEQTLSNLAAIAAEEELVVLGDVSKRQPPPLYLRHPVIKTPSMRKMQVHRLQQEVRRMSLYVAGILEVTKSANRDTCPMCPYKEMCELHETGSGWVEFRDQMMRATDPYEDHRKYA